MKRFKFFITALLTVMLFAGTVIAGDVEDIKAELEKSINEFNSKQEAYFSHLADDFQAFNGITKTLLYENKAEWVSWIKALWDLPYVNYQQQHNSVRVYNGDAAIINGYDTFTAVAKDGTSETLSGRVTINLVKMDGKWMIVNYHFSIFF